MDKRIRVFWDVEPEFDLEELGLPDVIYVPESIEDIEEYISDEYGYCIESYIVDE